MRLMSIVFILSLFGTCFAGGWVNGYTDSNGKYHPGHYESGYSSTSSTTTENTTNTYHTKIYKADDDSYKPKTEYVRPYVKKDGTFVNGYWRSKKDN